MPNLIDMLSGTPWWVYVVFCVVTYSGLKSCSPSQMAPRDAVIVPVALLAWALYALVVSDAHILIGAATWGGGLLCGLLLSWAMFRNDEMRLDDVGRKVIVLGSKSPLIVSLALFGVAYFFGYQKAVAPEKLLTVQFVTLMALASGLAVGFFLGRALHIYSAHRGLLNARRGLSGRIK